jgi:hypothetical protein
MVVVTITSKISVDRFQTMYVAWVDQSLYGAVDRLRIMETLTPKGVEYFIRSHWSHT